jgi:hypothetical protein
MRIYTGLRSDALQEKEERLKMWTLVIHLNHCVFQVWFTEYRRVCNLQMPHPKQEQSN